MIFHKDSKANLTYEAYQGQTMLSFPFQPWGKRVIFILQYPGWLDICIGLLYSHVSLEVTNWLGIEK